jgi:hypothetical protein
MRLIPVILTSDSLVVCTGEEVAIAVPAPKTATKPLTLLGSFGAGRFRATKQMHTERLALPVLWAVVLVIA